MLHKLRNRMFRRGRNFDPAAAERALAATKAKQHRREVQNRQGSQATGMGPGMGVDGGF